MNVSELFRIWNSAGSLRLYSTVTFKPSSATWSTHSATVLTNLSQMVQYGSPLWEIILSDAGHMLSSFAPSHLPIAALSLACLITCDLSFLLGLTSDPDGQDDHISGRTHTTSRPADSMRSLASAILCPFHSFASAIRNSRPSKPIFEICRTTSLSANCFSKL